MVVKEAKGAIITDVDGNTFLDFTTGIGVQNMGHCNEEVVKTIGAQCEKYIHTSFNVMMYESYIELAEKLCEITQGALPKGYCW